MTIETSLLGGLTIGLASAAKLATTGRITGISGTWGGLIKGNLDTWRIAFIGGLGAGGLLALQFMPGTIQALPDSYSIPRAVAAGLLVGYGTSLGSGCTSGHGVCGLARLSKRSLASVMTFMATGALVASLSGTAVACGIPAGHVPAWVAPTAEQLLQSGSVLGLSLATVLLLRVVAGLKLVPAALLGVASEFAFGTIFALGLAAGGMVMPAKVAAFLSPLATYFDPSLMAVMGGALMVTTPAFQYIMRSNKVPLCAPCLDLPTKTAIDAPLLMGAALFGAGWGLGGMCPGPALVSLVQPSAQNVVFVAMMSIGMLLQARKSPSMTTKAIGKGIM